MDKEVCRKKVIGDCSLCSFILYCFQLRGIKETCNCTPYAKWGVVIPESSLVIFYSSPVLTFGRFKKKTDIYLSSPNNPPSTSVSHFSIYIQSQTVYLSLQSYLYVIYITLYRNFQLFCSHHKYF